MVAKVNPTAARLCLLVEIEPVALLVLMLRPAANVMDPDAPQRTDPPRRKPLCYLLLSLLEQCHRQLQRLKSSLFHLALQTCRRPGPSVGPLPVALTGLPFVPAQRDEDVFACSRLLPLVHAILRRHVRVAQVYNGLVSFSVDVLERMRPDAQQVIGWPTSLPKCSQEQATS